MAVHPARARVLNSSPPGVNSRYVLYWCQMNRRAHGNHAFAYAAELATQHHLPLLVYEGLTFSCPFASDRLFTFLLEGVPAMQTAVEASGAGYLFFLRATPQDPNDVLYRLAKNAHSVVTDDYPAFLTARHNLDVPSRIGVPYIAVDSSCIVPMSVHDKRAWGAYTIRPKIKRELPAWLAPLEPVRLGAKWSDDLLPPGMPTLRTAISPVNLAQQVAACQIDHTIRPSLSFNGGMDQASLHLDVFLEHRLARYSGESNQPSKHATSDLSPYLHFGQISSLDIALAVKQRAAEAKLMADDFLEELIVRRELAFNFARFTPSHQSLDCLPDWCHRTMEKHAADPRPVVYTPLQLERAETHDPLWNATQKELLLRGKIHGYYRMYWGKKIIEWSRACKQALEVMIRLHDVYALDGRDPNTYTNILWCFGLHDRPWGERPIFGQLRYMSLDGMKRKTDTAAYIREIDYLEHTGKDPFRL